jgi:hypothetical protein
MFAMKRQIFCFGLLVVSLALADGIPAAQAQQFDAPPAAAPPADKEYYYGPTASQGEPKSIAQQKAEQRAQARMARLDAMRWYGFSQARPLATGIPFTSMYSPAWSQPGGRPFAWYTGNAQRVDRTRYYYGYFY